jgi:hypothetical protein
MRGAFLARDYSMSLTARTVAWGWMAYGVVSLLYSLATQHILTFGGFVFIFIAAYLLKGRVWAWGLLTAFSGLYALVALIGISLFAASHGHPAHSKYYELRIHSMPDLLGAVLALFLCATSLFVLLHDRPPTSQYRS